MILERTHLAAIRKALRHYKDRLTLLMESEDIEGAKEHVDQDLARTIDECDKALADLSQADMEPGERFMNHNIRYGLTGKNQKTINDAFQCYIQDLELSKKSVRDRLGGIGISFEEVNMEINRCKDVLSLAKELTQL